MRQIPVINGQHSDIDVVYSDFPTFGEGPGCFHDRTDNWRRAMHSGWHLPVRRRIPPSKKKRFGPFRRKDCLHPIFQ